MGFASLLLLLPMGAGLMAFALTPRSIDSTPPRKPQVINSILHWTAGVFAAGAMIYAVILLFGPCIQSSTGVTHYRGHDPGVSVLDLHWEASEWRRSRAWNLASVPDGGTEPLPALRQLTIVVSAEKRATVRLVVDVPQRTYRLEGGADNTMRHGAWEDFDVSAWAQATRFQPVDYVYLQLVVIREQLNELMKRNDVALKSSFLQAVGGNSKRSEAVPRVISRGILLTGGIIWLSGCLFLSRRAHRVTTAS